MIKDYEEPSIWTMLVVFICLVLGVMWLDDIHGPEQPPIEDYTGLCVRPTPQGGC